MMAGLYSLLGISCLGIFVFQVLGSQTSDAARRAAAMAALAPLVGLLALGAVWPSIHTLHAMLVLPAAISLAASLLRPRLLARARLRAYALFAQALTIVSSGLQIWWM